MSRSRRVQLVGIVIWLVAFALALMADRRVAEWVRKYSPLDRRSIFVPIVKLPGHFLFTVALAIMVAVFHRRRWLAALPLLIAGPLVGITYMLLKWATGRRRPVLTDKSSPIHPFEFHPFLHGLQGLIHAESGLSFPSGHATLAFATATALAAALPRWTMLFFAIATAVAAERVFENAHYLSDVVAGAGLGVLCGWIAIRSVDPRAAQNTNPAPETRTYTVAK